MRHLIILTGLSCTLKDSVANNLQDMMGAVKFPDVNRNLVDTLTSIAEVPEMVDSPRKLPNIMLCSNRIQVYKSFLEGYESVSKETGTQVFVMQRTVLEHLFFDNSDSITLVNREKLIEEERKFLSKFDKVTMVLIKNSNEGMLRKYWLTDDLRVAITKSKDKIESYFKMQEPYENFISKLKPIDFKFEISGEQELDSDDLTNTAASIADAISRLN